MTINKQKLIELLAQKTGLEKGQVEQQLSGLIKRIHQAAEEGKKFEVEDFGTFSVVDGVLQFEPAEELRTEINHKYAGMEPIELIGSFQHPDEKEIQRDTDAEEEISEQPAPGKADTDMDMDTDAAAAAADTDTDVDAEEEEQAEEDDIWGLDSLDKELSRAGEQDPGPGEEDAGPAEEEEEQPQDVFKAGQGELQEKQEEEIDFSFLKESIEAEQKRSDDAEEEEPFDPFAELEKEEEQDTAAPPKSMPKKEKQEDPIGTVLVIFSVIAVIGIGGWSLYEFDLIPGFGDDAPATSQVTDTNGPETDPEPQQSTEENNVDEEELNEPDNDNGNAGEQAGNTASEPDDEDEVTDTGEEQEEEQQQQAVYGLTGDVVEEANGGYTLVVHSLRQERNAREQQQTLEEEGYRTILTEARVNGEQYWRVSIGQFETIPDAQEAGESLEEPYLSNYFIKRIQ